MPGHVPAAYLAVQQQWSVDIDYCTVCSSGVHKEPGPIPAVYLAIQQQWSVDVDYCTVCSSGVHREPWQYSSSGPRTMIIVLCVPVEYTKSQDPYLLRTWQYSSSGPRTLIALSPDARTVALATSSSVSVYSVTSDDCIATFQDVFSGTVVLETWELTVKHFVWNRSDILGSSRRLAVVVSGMNKVTLCMAQLVLGWLTNFRWVYYLGL